MSLCVALVLAAPAHGAAERIDTSATSRSADAPLITLPDANADASADALRAAPPVRLMPRYSAASAAPAARPGRYPWGNAPFTYIGEDTRLDAVLKDFAGQYAIQVSIGPRVAGQVHGKLSAASPTAFLDTLAEAYGLDWFYATGTLHVSRRADRVSRVIALHGHPAADVALLLQGTGVLNTRFRWTELPRDDRLAIEGPPAYVRLVEATVDSLPDDPDPLEYGFFPLRHARVQDRTIQYRDKEIVVPGLATIISRLLTDRSLLARGKETTRRTMTPLPPMRGLGASVAASARRKDSNVFDDDAAAAGRSVWPDSGSGRSAPGAFGDLGPGPDNPLPNGAPSALDSFSAPASDTRISVVADSRLNALVVRAPKAVLNACRALIARLDVAVPLVQIEAVIVDVDDSVAKELGVDWSLKSRHVSFTTDERRQHSESDDFDSGISSILPSRINFMARIHALVNDGHARVVSRPSILTQNNAAALLDMSETFYIRNRGDRAVETVPITAGLMLNIVPGVVPDDSPAPRVVMDIQIEDGHRSNEFVEDLPIVKRSTISTQAVVRDGQSLLIAGHQVNHSQTSDRSVPGLSKIPLVGKLFQRTERSNSVSKRFFLITPRVIDMDAPAATSLPADPDLAAAIKQVAQARFADTVNAETMP